MNTNGYMAGIADFRHGRTPEHSQTAYDFPRYATTELQAEYTASYYEAKRDMERARELNNAWFQFNMEELEGSTK